MIGASVNPTTLTVGKTGTLDNHAATVVGRAVLRSGDSYRWHEFYVELDNGLRLILVYEAGAWKRFEEFKPERDFTAEDAEIYRVGSGIELHGRTGEVKYVSTSRVVYAEGKTWDGVRAGSEARYFNAECFDGEMIVVSWTGEEIEFYTGRKLASYVVPRAFQLPKPSVVKTLLWGGSGSLSADSSTVLGVLALVGAFGIFIWSHYKPSTPIIDPAPIAAPPATVLTDGMQANLAGEHFVVRGHTLVEIDEPRARFKRYEYELVDDRGGGALLVEDLNPNVHDWVVFRALTAPPGLAPTIAATAVEGSTLKLEGHADAKVQRLLLTRPLGGSGAAAALPAGSIRYGFLARSGATWFLVRWTDASLDLEEGKNVSAADILAAANATAKHQP